MGKRRSVIAFSAALALMLLLTTALTGCGKHGTAPEQAGPAATAAPAATAEPAETRRQDGERFEEVIVMEGMEETVLYEHVRNDTIGIEMDYDVDRFQRRGEGDLECFVSVYDLPDAPENYLEVRYNPQDAETVAAAVRAALSREYDLLESTRELERAGSCLRIEASVIKGTNRMADQLQAVVIIPAADGCRVATAHYAAEGAEGFGRRFNYMLNTLSVMESVGEKRLSNEQALAAVRRICYLNDPELENIVGAGEYPVYWDVFSTDTGITVLYRAYTGAQIRYYIDPVSGETYVTELVPGIINEEQRTEEALNAWDYLF